jgi:hypothetical protein
MDICSVWMCMFECMDVYKCMFCIDAAGCMFECMNLWIYGCMFECICMNLWMYFWMYMYESMPKLLTHIWPSFTNCIKFQITVFKDPNTTYLYNVAIWALLLKIPTVFARNFNVLLWQLCDCCSCPSPPLMAVNLLHLVFCNAHFLGHFWLVAPNSSHNMEDLQAHCWI